jgi:hypothetical protein
MDIERFSQHLASESHSRDDLKAMFQRARAKGLHEHAALAKDALDRRFPGWDIVRSRRGGSKPTVARYRNGERYCETTKDAFVWLLERFGDANGAVFTEASRDALTSALGRERNYLARTPEGLFPNNAELVTDTTHYARLSNGWYVDVNLNSQQKLRILLELSKPAGLFFVDDWDFEVLDATEEFARARTDAMVARKIQKDLDDLV